MQNEINLHEVREEYFKHLENQPPQRAKDVPYQKIIGPSGLLWLLLGLFVCPFIGIAFGWAPYLINTHPFVFVLLGAMTFILLLLPEYFYHNIKRTKRWAKKHHPHIYKTIYRFQEKEKMDRMVVGPCLLKVEGKNYFLGPYVRQLWNEKQATITGYILLNDQGKLVDDELLFQKAFLTYAYSMIGAISGQNTEIGEIWTLTENTRTYIPRAEKKLRNARKFFEQINHSADLEILLGYMPDLYEAAKDALTIYKGREKFRKAMGYSFGYEYLYEDALEEQKMREAFGKYMLIAHFKTLNNVRVLAARLRENPRNSNAMVKNSTATRSLEAIWNFAFMLSNLIEKMSKEGIPQENDIKLFREKIAHAKTAKEIFSD